MSLRPWQSAWQDALYGEQGFFLRHRPRDHFRTAVAIPAYAVAIRRLAGLVDEALGRPDPFDVVDVGAGRGELLAGLGDVPARWRLTGVDLADAGRPAPPIRWAAAVPECTGLLVANEWLDDVPLPVLRDGRLVEVDATGAERLGGPAEPADLAWARRWWPGPGRVEVGLPRDRAWAAAVSRLRRGLAVAMDYGHLRSDRRPTLTGYRDGRQVAPLPDGGCDLTAHVALDSCAAASGSRLLRQREALLALGVDPVGPSPAGASTDPAGYLDALQAASQAATLLDRDGLGGFGWLVRAEGIRDPLLMVRGATIAG